MGEGHYWYEVLEPRSHKQQSLGKCWSAVCVPPAIPPPPSKQLLECGVVHWYHKPGSFDSVHRFTILSLSTAQLLLILNIEACEAAILKKIFWADKCTNKLIIVGYPAAVKWVNMQHTLNSHSIWLVDSAVCILETAGKSFIRILAAGRVINDT